MKKRAGFRVLFIAFLSLLTTAGMASTASAQSEEFESESAPVAASSQGLGPVISKALDPVAGLGGWYWGLLEDPVLTAGTTIVASDASIPSTIYVGGPGYIAVSSNSGAEWKKTLNIEERAISVITANDDDVDDEGNVQTLTKDQKLSILREYISQGLEDDEYDTTEIEELQNEITDDELLDASSIDDIEVLKDLQLSMERDLSLALESNRENDVALSVSLSEFDSFIMRYAAMTNSGADEDYAVSIAARAPVVWQFISTPALTYAITSGAIYMTSDHGNTWQATLEAPENSAILSFMTSADAQIMGIGLSDGMLFSRDGGENWIQLNEFMDGAVFEIKQAGNTIWALTTESLYYSTDRGLTWDEAVVPTVDGEFITSILPGRQDNILVLTNYSIYYSIDQKSWIDVPCAPFAEETVRQILSADDTLSSFTVRTDAHVFQLTPNGWIAQNNLLFANDLGYMMTFNDSYSLAAATAPSGLWLAQPSPQLAVSEEYRNLFKLWESEPDDYEVIQRALEAHFLDDMVDKNWGMRSRLSWLLPTFTFDYSHLQKNTTTSKMDVTFDRDYSETASLTQSETYNFKREKQTYWQVMARWNVEIGKGLKDEISSTRQEATLRARRNAIVKLVRTQLNKRHASQTTLMLALPKLPETKKTTVKKAIKTTLALQEAEASLHYLTGGYYISAVKDINVPK